MEDAYSVEAARVAQLALEVLELELEVELAPVPLPEPHVDLLQVVQED